MPSLLEVLGCKYADGLVLLGSQLAYETHEEFPRNRSSDGAGACMRWNWDRGTDKSVWK